MGEPPLVSCIIPVRNGAAHLGEALESVFAQSYAPLEVIVADDGSSDDSQAIAGAFPGVTVLELPPSGVSVARNRAVEASRGEWLAFLDADDRWLPGKIAAQVATAEADPGLGLVLCKQLFDFEGPIPDWFNGPRDDGSYSAFEPSAWLVRATTFKEVGPFDPERELGEDVQWLARAWNLGVRHTVLEETFVRRRIHSRNASARLAGAGKTVLEVLRESIAMKRATEGSHRDR